MWYMSVTVYYTILLTIIHHILYKIHIYASFFRVFFVLRIRSLNLCNHTGCSGALAIVMSWSACERLGLLTTIYSVKEKGARGPRS